MRARARGLSLTSTTCALPDSRIARAASSSARLSPPSGGSSWIETTNSSVLQQPLQLGLALLRVVHDRQSPLVDGERTRRRPVRVDRGADRRDLRGRRAAAAADQARAEPARLRGELGEVLRRRVRVDDCAARRGSRGRRSAAPRGRARRAASPASAASALAGPAPWFAPDRRDAELREPRAGLSRGHAAERLRLLVERHQRDDRQARDAAHRLDRRPRARRGRRTSRP